MRTRIKICGMTRIEDVENAIALGADAIGFVFAESKRKVEPQWVKDVISTLPPFVITVGVFMNQPIDIIEESVRVTSVDVIQLHGDEAFDPNFVCRMSKLRRVIRRIPVCPGDTTEDLEKRIRQIPASAYLLDPGGGSGISFDWSIARDLPQPIILAGGLTPENVKKAISLARPWAVDVSSGIEFSLGKKDLEKMRRFIQEVQCLE